MTKEEAIKAIKDNYPTSGYYILREALDIVIETLEKQNDINRMIDEIESTAWFVHGASRKGEGTEPLYKAEDILKICDKYKTEEDEQMKAIERLECLEEAWKNAENTTNNYLTTEEKREVAGLLDILRVIIEEVE